MSSRRDFDLHKVGVIYFGGEDKVGEFLKKLKRVSSVSGTQYIFRNYIDSNNGVLVLQLALKSYNDASIPLILLIDKEFLEKIWITPSKTSILNYILSYTSKYCLHVWFDLTVELVEKFSVSLARREDGFRRTAYEELEKLSDKELSEKLSLLLKDTESSISYENYSIQDDEGYRLKEYKVTKTIIDKTESHESSLKPTQKKNPKVIKHSTSTSTSSSPSKAQSKKKKQKGSNAYKQAAATFDSSLLSPNPNYLIERLSYKEKQKIGNMLNVGYGANWKQIAAYYDYTPSEIRKIESDEKNKDGPAHFLLDSLPSRYPDLTLKDLEEKCRLISRTDIANEINKLMQK